MNKITSIYNMQKLEKEFRINSEGKLIGKMARLRKYHNINWSQNEKQLIKLYEKSRGGPDKRLKKQSTKLKYAVEWAVEKANREIEIKNKQIKQDNMKKIIIQVKKKTIKSSEPEPDIGTLRRYLLKYKGSSVGVKYVQNGKTRRDKFYNVPNGTTDFNRFWKKISKDHWVVDSEDTVFSFFPNGTLYFTRGEPVKMNKKIRKQIFREGVTNCLLTPMRDWFTEYLSPPNISESTRKKYRAARNKLNKYINKYPNGVPEEDLENIAKHLNVKLEIELPCNKTNNYTLVGPRDGMKKFSFVNTRLHHVELNAIGNKTDKVIKVTQQELENIVENSTEMVHYTKSNKKVNSVLTTKARYSVDDDYRNSAYEFMKKYEIDICSLDYNDKKNVLLNEFVLSSVHYNGTVDYKSTRPNSVEEYISYMDFKKIDIDVDPFNIDEDEFVKRKYPTLQHIDQVKAYTQSKATKYYKGFLGKITDFRQTNEIVAVGLYLIDNINYDNCLPNFKLHLLTLKPYENRIPYPSPELEYLRDNGVTFDILAGCYGVQPLYFEFTDEMLNNRCQPVNEGEKGVPYYSKWCGECNSINPTNKLFIRGTKDYAEMLRNYSDRDKFTMVGDNEIVVEYTKKYCYHLSHVTAFITSYQRINLLEQLKKIDHSQVVRVCVDGIYFEPLKFKTLNPDIESLINGYSFIPDKTFRFQDKFKFKNRAWERYCDIELSNRSTDKLVNSLAPFKPNAMTTLISGAGGTGKTEGVLSDTGLINRLFTVVSWQLSTQKGDQYNIDNNVVARLLSGDPHDFKKKYSNIIIDECSMINEAQVELFKKRFKGLKLIFMGDLDCQIKPIEGIMMNKSQVDNVIELTHNYRVTDKELKNVLDDMRQTIINMNENDEDEQQKQIEKYIKQFNYIPYEEIEYDYKNGDIIIASTNRTKDKYTARYATTEALQDDIIHIDKLKDPSFKEINRKITFNNELKNRVKTGYNGVGNKYKVVVNTDELCNGQLFLDEKPSAKHQVIHGFTIFAVQGNTQPARVIIDAYNIKDMRTLYTAVARARTKDQIMFTQAM